ncbi:hypothetical protein N7488_004794 [Penicillium malachiteum]|nr:hypothetical protein N7488_004794 [Penicillium malachiteum]
MLHFEHDMLHCEVFRLALQTHVDTCTQALFPTAPLDLIDKTRDQCLFYAVRMMQTLQTLYSEVGDDNLKVLDPSLAMLCFASMKIQLLYAAAREPVDVGEIAVNVETTAGFEVLLNFTESVSKYFRHVTMA